MPESISKISFAFKENNMCAFMNQSSKEKYMKNYYSREDIDLVGSFSGATKIDPGGGDSEPWCGPFRSFEESLIRQFIRNSIVMNH